MKFRKDILQMEAGRETDRICGFIRDQVSGKKKKGVVLGLSGGIDSALCAELCARALGRDKVLGLILPEKESNPVSREFAAKQAGKMGLKTEIQDITPVLEAFGTYEKRDSLVKQIFPEYNSDFDLKITLPPDLLQRDSMNYFTLTIENGRDQSRSKRLTASQLQGIVSATNTKQRTRMMYLYYAAERLNYAVCGTTNRNETLLGFFVKYGDGGVDLEPIAQLYKTQVYSLARQFPVIEEIMLRTPTPDTFSAHVSDEEFYFRMPYDVLDLLLFAWENRVDVDVVCDAMQLSGEQVIRAFRDFNAKHKASRHLREMPPSLLAMTK